jgi:hypothetical protein
MRTTEMARKAKTQNETPGDKPVVNTGIDMLDTMEAIEEFEMPEIDLDFSLSSDLKEMAQKMGRIEAENLVKLFYRLQDQRIRATRTGRRTRWRRTSAASTPRSPRST